MNVIFVYSLDDVQSSERPLRSQEQIQFGISYISAFLRKNHHNTKLIVLSKIFKNAYKEIIDKYVKDYSPKLFCFTAISSECDFITLIAKYVKEHYPDIYLLFPYMHF